MKILVVAQGKLKDRALRGLTDDYKKRLARYVAVDELELKDGEALSRRLPTEHWLVMLEVWGEALSSPGLASRLETWASRQKGNICFVIGGANGIPKEVSQRGHAHLSLSSLTLPHRLVRLLLFEQLYRAMTILRGEPYAREG